MDASTRTIGRPRHDTKRLAIEKLLIEGFTPAMVRESTGSSLTVIYEVRRAIKKGAAHASKPQETPGQTDEPGTPSLAQPGSRSRG